MSQVKFQKLIDDFSPSSLAEIFTGQGLFAIQQNLLPSFNDKQFIEFNHLGDFRLEDDANIVVVCARSLTPLNERASRKTQYDLGKKVLKNFQKARAGIFVYYDSKGDFRMSLIYADYVGTKINYSTFRRFTYFVSKQQKNVTFLQQVASLKFTNFKELKELFSVEKVTKEFFKNYRDLFIEILEDFEDNKEFQNIVVKTGISTTPDFVKKLMGQVVFLYFVQKKGWLGVRPNENWGTGDQGYLRSLFETCKKCNKNYFNDYLEPLFYEALAEKRGEDDFFEQLNCRIPFLNGGLFESVYAWKNTEIKIHNEVLGKLLDFFDRYNFTVDENTPSDQEISVDPEMLGKIFENLLEVKDRKDKGAFYTPREIVHYMCRESLIQHLVSEDTAPEERIRKLFENKDTDLSIVVENEEKTRNIKELKDIADKVDVSLRNVKVVDPAVGSGAFPMGMLNEISSVRHYLNTNFLHKTNDIGKELSLYDIKKETLENCIYAVDLEPGAVEIAKLRFWLSLIVEFESSDPKIAPPVLPNLDYKIMQGNSLLEEYEDIKLFDENIIKTVDADKEKQIDDLKNRQSILQKEYFGLYADNKLTPIKKVELDAEAKNIHNQLKRLTQKEEITMESAGLFDFDKHKDSKLKAEELKSLQKQFFETNKKDKKESIKKQIEKIEWELIEATLIEQGKTSELSKIEGFKKSKTKPFFLWKLHFADVFEQKGGFDIVIGNPPYVSAIKHAKDNSKEREMLKIKYPELKGSFDLYAVFLLKGVELKKINGVYSWIIPNKFLIADYSKEVFKELKKNGLYSTIDVSKHNVFHDVGVYPIILLGGGNEKKYIHYEVEKLEDLKTGELSPFKEIFDFQTFKDFKIEIGSGTTGFQAKDIIPLISNGNESPKDSIPFAVSGSIDPNLINTENVRYMGTKYEFPHIKFDSEIIAKSKWNFWNKPKIVVAGMTKRIEAVYIETPLALGVGCYAIHGYDKFDPRFLLGILNSKFLTYFLNTKFKDKHLAGGYLAINKSTIEQLPLVDISLELQQPFVNLVDKVLSITKTEDYLTNVEKQDEVKRLEHQIDELVYKLYDLTPEEIEIVENSSKK